MSRSALTATVAAIERLRRERMSSPAIARQLALPRSTVGALLRRLGLGRLQALEAKPPTIRFERQRPGELIHIDTKKLGASPVRAAVSPATGVIAPRASVGMTSTSPEAREGGDASRLAYTEILPSERKEDATAFLTRALAFFAADGVTVERVMTDNGNTYRSHLFRADRQSRAPAHPHQTLHTGHQRQAERLFQTLCTNGLTPEPTRHPPNELTPCCPGLTAIITTDPIQPSSASHPPPG